jgi:hypothetical protein
MMQFTRILLTVLHDINDSYLEKEKKKTEDLDLNVGNNKAFFRRLQNAQKQKYAHSSAQP